MAEPMPASVNWFGKSVVEADGSTTTILTIYTDSATFEFDLGAEHAKPMGRLLLNAPQDLDEAMSEVERLRVELEANRQRWYHDDQSRTICVAGHDPETRQCADGGGRVLSEVEYLTQLVEIWEGLTKMATEGEDKARALAARLAAELADARAVMNKALGEVEHEEVVYLLNRYLSAHPSTTEKGEA